VGNPPNHVYGSISIGIRDNGFQFFSNNDTTERSDDAILENSIAINGIQNGMRASSVKNATIKNVTFFNNGNTGSVIDGSTATITGPSVTVTNALSFTNGGLEFSINNTYYGANWLIDYSNKGGSTGTMSPSTHAQITNMNTTTPTLMGTGTNQCIVYVPGGHDGQGGTNPQIGGVSSNMAGAGENGEDIGASIVYRYENGVLSNTKLWNQSTGAFPCGATVTGVNDDATFPNSACVNVHERLNVGVNGCAIP
jgi:hypothetical protein